MNWIKKNWYTITFIANKPRAIAIKSLIPLQKRLLLKCLSECSLDSRSFGRGRVSENVLQLSFRSKMRLSQLEMISDAEFHNLVRFCIDDGYISMPKARTGLYLTGIIDNDYNLTSKGMDYIQWWYYPFAIFKFIIALGIVSTILSVLLSHYFANNGNSANIENSAKK